MIDIRAVIEKEYISQYNNIPQKIEPLAESGSSRMYFRIHGDDEETLIAVYNDNVEENKSFVSFAHHFMKYKLKVPEILHVADNCKIYFQEDLGDTSVFDVLSNRKTAELSNFETDLMKQILAELLKFQIDASSDIDYSNCFASKKFDATLLRWDLNYFKYYFLKLTGVVFSEPVLEQEFKKLEQYWEQLPSDYFLYRDFQSRNIMQKDDDVYFIDFQGGMQGPLQYDVAALLYQARLKLTKQTKDSLLNFYIDRAGEKISVDANEFKSQFYVVVFVRILQTLGAYGFRGLYEKKSHFLKSIPAAIEGLREILRELPLDLEIPALKSYCEQICSLDINQALGLKKKLTVAIVSFAYKRGMPIDTSGNGGGYVFDCRAVPNPGIYDEYKPLTGEDAAVQKFFSKTPQMAEFLSHSFAMVDMHVEKFIERGFSSLMVGFGCTGGQHRSVYSAEMLAKHISEKYDVQVTLKHVEQEMKRNQEHYLKSAQ